MHGFMLTIQPDGTQAVKEYHGKVPLADIKEGLDQAWLEMVPFLDEIVIDGIHVHCIAYCDEYAKIKGLPFNQAAHARWEEAVGRRIAGDFLCGPVVFLWGDEAFMRSM
jgi:hypothetical protein